MIAISERHNQVLKCLQKYANSGMVTINLDMFSEVVDITPKSMRNYIYQLHSLGLVEKITSSTYKILPQQTYVSRCRLSSRHPLVRKIRKIIHRSSTDRAIARTMTHSVIAERCGTSPYKVSYAINYMRKHGLLKPINITGRNGRSTVYDCIDNVTCVVRNHRAKVTQAGK